MTEEEWANESNINKMSWSNMSLHKVLKRGPNFRFTTQKLSQNDKDMAINRAVISMNVSIRRTLKARVIGEQLTKTREWELSKGLKFKAHRFHVNPGPPGIPVVVPDKQGLREWWQQCTREDITQSFGEYFTHAEVEMLPSRMFKCLSRTESMGDFVKRNRKRL